MTIQISFTDEDLALLKRRFEIANKEDLCNAVWECIDGYMNKSPTSAANQFESHMNESGEWVRTYISDDDSPIGRRLTAQCSICRAFVGDYEWVVNHSARCPYCRARLYR